MTDAELDALDVKLASQIGDDVQVIFNHEYLFKQSRAAIAALRSDLAAVQPVQMRVKPLEFNFLNLGRFAYSVPSIVGYYEINHDADLFSVWHNGSSIHHALPTIASAKSAAQADYESRILAALEPQPDPRDEVIARLVEAAEPFAQVRIKDGVSQAGDIGRTDVTNIRAALAAAKAVRT